MTYGLKVTSTYGYNQIDSDTYDEGFYVKDVRGPTSSVPASLFKPDDGDFLFIRRLDDATNYYVYVRLNGSNYEFRKCAGGMVPRIPNNSAGDGFGYVQCMVVGRQGQKTYPAGYGLRILKPNSTVAFDSRAYTSNKSFEITKVLLWNTVGSPNGAYPYPSPTSGGVRFHSGSNNEWVCMNTASFRQQANLYTTSSKIQTFRVGLSGIYFWSTALSPGAINGYGLPNLSTILIASGG